MPVAANWPDAPCAYLHLSTGYDGAANEAQRLGWPYRRIDAGHFHILNSPAEVADALLEIADLATAD